MPQGQIPCDSQVAINHVAKDLSSNCLLNYHLNQTNYMYAAPYS
jgi:hypothetical protein